MSTEDASGVVQKLREGSVEYRLADGGTSVLVRSDKLAESRLALAAVGLPKTGRIGFELFDKNTFGETEFVEKVNYARALEGELERSVMSIAEVEHARIHLVMQKDSVFTEQHLPAKASVVVRLRLGARLSPVNVNAIANLVAGAVEGLAPGAISIVDEAGNLLNKPRTPTDTLAQVSDELVQFRQQTERELVAKIHSTLEPLTGPEHVRANVSVDCDFSSAELQEESYDPQRTVVSNSQKSEESSERGVASGVPGTPSNLPSPPLAPLGGLGQTSRRSESTVYQASRLVRHTKTPQGVVRRMSVSVLVDNLVEWQGSGTARRRVLVPPTPDSLRAMRDLVAAATGINPQRGDQLIVESLPFQVSLAGGSSPEPDSAAGRGSADKVDIRNRYYAGVAFVILLAAAAYFYLQRRNAEIQLSEAAETVMAEVSSGPLEYAEEFPEPQMEELEPLERVREFAKTDPQFTANVIRHWLRDTENPPA